VKHEQGNIDFDTAEVWRNAQQRRADDLGALLRDYLARQRTEAGASEKGPSYAAGQPWPI